MRYSRMPVNRPSTAGATFPYRQLTITACIILKKSDRGEADELVRFLSRDLGWLTGVAKNSRRSRVRFGGHLEPLSLVELNIRPRRRDEMVWIEDAQVKTGFVRIRSDLFRVANALYLLELSSVLIPEGQPDDESFDLLSGALESLDTGAFTRVSLLLDEMRLLGLSGYAPRFDLCPACGKPVASGQEAAFSVALGGACHKSCLPRDSERLIISPDTMAVVRRGLELDKEAAARLRMGKRGIEELRSALSAFVRYTRGGEINSLHFMETVASGS